MTLLPEYQLARAANAIKANRQRRYLRDQELETARSKAYYHAGPGKEASARWRERNRDILRVARKLGVPVTEARVFLSYWE